MRAAQAKDCNARGGDAFVAATIAASLVVGGLYRARARTERDPRRLQYDGLRPERRRHLPVHQLSAGDPTGLCANPPAAISLPFSLNFFGTNYNSFFLNNNGNLTFDSPLSAFTPANLCPGHAVIAPFFADVDTAHGNTVRFGTGVVGGHTAWGATWPGVGCFNKNTAVLELLPGACLIDRSDIAAERLRHRVQLRPDQVGHRPANGGGSACVRRNNASARVRLLGRTAPDTFELPGSGVQQRFPRRQLARPGSSRTTATARSWGATSSRSATDRRSDPQRREDGHRGRHRDVDPGRHQLRRGLLPATTRRGTAVTLTQRPSPDRYSTAGRAAGARARVATCTVNVNTTREPRSSTSRRPNAACRGTTGDDRQRALVNNGVAGPGLLLVKKYSAAVPPVGHAASRASAAG